MMPSAFGLRGPRRKIRGRDIAGRVEAVGRDVTRLHPGDEVYGDLGHAGGAFAEYACVPEDAVDHKPTNLTFEQAAAVPLAGNTALMGLRDLARVRPDRRVLINGASGGVGTFAVQIAKAFGAVVTAVCSTRHVTLMGWLGADRVVDYTREDFARDGCSYDVVFDLVGNRTLGDLRRVLTPTGTLVFSGGGVSGGGRPRVVGPMGLTIRGQLAARLVRQRLLLLMEKPSAANLAALRELIESGRVTPVIDQTYPLHKVPEAIRYVEAEHPHGKVVITP
jgi:NADPH:quinone reductase-like Zn-dependent oxidoreductase